MLSHVVPCHMSLSMLCSKLTVYCWKLQCFFLDHLILLLITLTSEFRVHWAGSQLKTENRTLHLTFFVFLLITLSTDLTSHRGGFHLKIVPHFYCIVPNIVHIWVLLLHNPTNNQALCLFQNPKHRSIGRVFPTIYYMPSDNQILLKIKLIFITQWVLKLLGSTQFWAKFEV